MKRRALAALRVLLVLSGAAAFAFQGCASVKGRTRAGVHHTVRPGETLWRICYAYKVNMETVCRLNGIENPESIRAGQELFIPGAEKVMNGVMHTVHPGETLWRICHVYQADEQAVCQINNIDNPAEVRAGQALFIPGASRVLEVPLPEERTPAPGAGRAAEPQRPVQLGSRTGSGHETAGAPIKPRGLDFAWPLKGPVTTWYGVRDGRKHDGIDIAVPKGTPIRAAEGGKVIYSDNGISGYGNLIIVQHPDGFTTVYAHNRRNLVKVDEPVKKGQVIAEVGATGRADGNHLHFEVRRNVKTVDPMLYLP
ncbi:MAG: M23 family metallopeptidase [bacterium]